MADFNPQVTETLEPILMKLDMVDHVRDPPHMTTLVGQHIMGGLGK